MHHFYLLLVPDPGRNQNIAELNKQPVLSVSPRINIGARICIISQTPGTSGGWSGAIITLGGNFHTLLHSLFSRVGVSCSFPLADEREVGCDCRCSDGAASGVTHVMTGVHCAEQRAQIHI